MASEKNPPAHEHAEEALEKADTNMTDEIHGFQTDFEHLPKGYYRSSFFIGTMLAVGTGLCAAVGGFGLAAPSLALINSEIGPDPNIVWVSLVYTLTLSIGLLLVGRLSDIFGRRWFLIGGTVLALLGCIVAAVAPNVPALIAGTALIGLGASAQQSFSFVSNELVPMKYRFYVNAYIYVWCYPTSGFGGAVSKAFILYTKSGWRGIYYLLIGLNVISGLLYIAFYHPPTFHMKHRLRTKTQQLKMFDYLGTALFVAGLVLFELGFLWGGSVYPWSSAHVLATLLIGAGTLVAFVLYELYAPLREPVLPMKLFKNIAWVSACTLLGLGASIYYAMAIIWPQMVAVLFTDDGGASMRAGWLNSIPSIAIVAGQIVGGCLATVLGKQKWQCIAVLTTGGTFLAAMAYSTPSTLVGSSCLLAVASFAIGWNESLCLTNAGIEVDDQQEIGTAVGMAGSLRSAISTVAATVYVVVLSNRLAATIPAEVPAKVIAAGLPASSVVSFLEGFSTGNFSTVKGLTPRILAVGTQAYKVASAHAYRTVFFTTLAFTGVAVVFAFWAPNVDDKMDGQVATTLHKGQGGRMVGEEVRIEKGVV